MSPESIRMQLDNIESGHTHTNIMDVLVITSCLYSLVYTLEAINTINVL